MVDKMKTVKKVLSILAIAFGVAMLACLIIFRAVILLDDLKMILNSFKTFGEDLFILIATLIFVIAIESWIIFAKEKGQKYSGPVYFAAFFIMVALGYNFREELNAYRDEIANGLIFYICYWLTLLVLLANIVVEAFDGIILPMRKKEAKETPIGVVPIKEEAKEEEQTEKENLVVEEEPQEEIKLESAVEEEQPELVEEIVVEEKEEQPEATEEKEEQTKTVEENETVEEIKLESSLEEEQPEVVEETSLEEKEEPIDEEQPEEVGEPTLEEKDESVEEEQIEDEQYDESVVVVEPEDEDPSDENFYEPFEEGTVDGEAEDLIALEEKVEELKFTYKKDLSIRLKMASSRTKEYYSSLVNRLSKYENLKVVNDKGGTKFVYEKKLVAYVGVFAKFVKLYLALDPEKYPVSTYHHKDVSTKKKYINAPFLLKVGSTRSFKYAEKLCTEFAKKLKLSAKEEHEAIDYVSQYQTTSKELMEIQNLGFLLKDTATLEEAQVLPKRGANGALLLENRELSKNKKLKVEVSIEELLANFESDEVIDMKSLKAKKLVPNNINWVKITASSECNKPLTVKANDFELDAIKLIVITGGTAVKIVKI